MREYEQASVVPPSGGQKAGGSTGWNDVFDSTVKLKAALEADAAVVAEGCGAQRNGGPRLILGDSLIRPRNVSVSTSRFSQ